MNRFHRSANSCRLPVVACAVVLLLPGCFGVSGNPAKLGNLPKGDIIRTHAEQGGDPANRIEEITTMIDPTTSETSAE